MPLIADIVIAALLVVGGTFALIGSFGLIRLTSAMQRLHAPTKATTIGVGTALVASVLDLWFAESIISMQEILVVAFLFVTAPLTALFLSKLHLHQQSDRAAIPPTGTDADWATFAHQPPPAPTTPNTTQNTAPDP